MSFSADLLACPACRGDLEALEARVVCRQCGRGYPVEEATPRLVLNEHGSVSGRALDEGPLIMRVLHRLVAQPAVYDWVQRAFGLNALVTRVRRHVAQADPHLLLDVGAGTGNFLTVAPPSATYVWLDNDQAKLRGFRAKDGARPALLADATRLPFKAKTVDLALCVALSHHLPDDTLELLVRELARVTRSHIVFADAVSVPGSVMNTLLWRYDRGAHPRSEEDLLKALALGFELEHVERFQTIHHYLLCVARPKAVT